MTAARALAVSTPRRNPSFPDLPAAEILPGYDFASWGGVFAPAGTPRPVVLKLNAAIAAAPVPRHSMPEAFGQLLQAEIKRWRTLLGR